MAAAFCRFDRFGDAGSGFPSYGATGFPAHEQPVGLHPRGDELFVRQRQERRPHERVAGPLRRCHHRSLQGMLRDTNHQPPTVRWPLH